MLIADPDPGSGIFLPSRIPDPGVKKASIPDPGYLREDYSIGQFETDAKHTLFKSFRTFNSFLMAFRVLKVPVGSGCAPADLYFYHCC
jgi:hypothetical protein